MNLPVSNWFQKNSLETFSGEAQLLEYCFPLLPPCPDEARPNPSPEDGDRQRKVLHIILELGTKVLLLAGVVDQDDLLHQLDRGAVDDRMNLKDTWW